MFRILCLLIGYGIGCIQTSYIMGKFFKRIDIRDFGSGNAGTTNTIRVMGFKVGVFVFIVDFLKAVAGYYLCMFLFKGENYLFEGINGILPGLYAGIGVILGHNFPFYMGFKGGKGVASSMGIIFCTDWRVMIIDFICGLITVVATKYVSLASLVITLLYPMLLLYFDFTVETVILSLFITAMAWFQHRANIKRLIAGKENKFSFRRKPS